MQLLALTWQTKTEGGRDIKFVCPGGWVGGQFFQEIIPLRGSILQAETCYILSLAEGPSPSVAIQVISGFAILSYQTFC